jgi:hypothetical protein
MKKPEEIDWTEFKDPEIVDWKRVRSAIEHENELTNHRFTWLMASQAFLFAAFGFTWHASTQTDVAADYRPLYQVALAVFALTGILICMFLSLGIRAAKRQHNELEVWWRDRRIIDVKRHPPLCGSDPRAFGDMPYYWIPYIFASAWVILALTALANLLRPYTNQITIALYALVPAILIFFLGRAYGRRKK